MRSWAWREGGTGFCEDSGVLERFVYWNGECGGRSDGPDQSMRKRLGSRAWPGGFTARPIILSPLGSSAVLSKFHPEKGLRFTPAPGSPLLHQSQQLDSVAQMKELGKYLDRPARKGERVLLSLKSKGGWRRWGPGPKSKCSGKDEVLGRKEWTSIFDSEGAS